MQVLVEHKVHRIPIVDSAGDLVSIVSQSHLVKLLRDNHSKFPAMKKKIGPLKLGYREVLSVKTNQRAIDAFNLIHKTVNFRMSYYSYLNFLQKVSGVAVLNEQQELVGNLSASDLKVHF